MSRSSDWRLPLQRVSFEELSRFAGNVATCLEAGIRVPDALLTSTRSAPGRPLPRIAEAAAERAAAGMELADALEPDAGRFPPFFIPVIRCGEQVGRLDEALRYLEEHCRLLVRPSRAMRNTWLYPLAIVVFGSIVKIAAHVLFAPMGRAAAYTAHTLAGYGLLAAVVWFFLAVPQAKSVLDQIKLFLPVIGQVERELAVNRFFHSFNMLYSTGGMRVEAMIELAARAVTNVAVRDDLLRAARAIESGSTVAEAFAAPATLTEDQRTTIAAGEHAGKLDTAFATISRHTGESVQHRLKKFNEISFRIVTLAVTFSIAATLLSLITAIRPSG